MMDRFDIIDISQPIAVNTACFPGDVQFSRQITVSYPESGVINLCAFTMSPHVGTHADAPVHVRGDLADNDESAAALPLAPFVGPAAVIDLSPWNGAITWEQVAPQIEAFTDCPPRLLFKTAKQIRPEVFEESYAWFSVDLIAPLARRGVQLIGIDTPSVDPVDSKTLDTHHALLAAGIAWLENLDLTDAACETPRTDFLLAAPLKFTELEASPVRALLLREHP